MMDQITCPYKIIGELIVTYVLIYMFVGGTGRENILGRRVSGIPCKNAYFNIVKVRVHSQISLVSTDVRKPTTYLETLKMLNVWVQQ
jgi:hypothetical protein